MMTISITFNLWPPMLLTSSSHSHLDRTAPPRRSLDETLSYVDQLAARAVTRRHAVSRSTRDAGPKCPICGGPRTERQKFCGATCRQRAHRARKAQTKSRPT